MKILGLKNNSDSFTKFRIPKSKKAYFPLMEITIDLGNNEFRAKVINADDSNKEDWVEVNERYLVTPFDMFKQFLKDCK